MAPDGIHDVCLEGGFVLLLRPDVLQVFPADLLPLREIGDDDGLAEEPVVLDEVLVPGPVQVHGTELDPAALDLWSEVAPDAFPGEPFDAHTGRAAHVAAEVRHEDGVRGDSRPSRHHRLTNSR
jgi:hypothetical protein